MEEKGWVLIPIYILKRDDLSKSEKILFGRILGLMSAEGFCYATNEYLSESIGMTPDLVSRSITSLVEKKLLVRELERDAKNPVIITKRKLFLGINMEMGKIPTPVVENPNSYPPKSQIEYKEKENTELENPQIRFQNAGIKITYKDFENLPEHYVIEMANKHRLFPGTVVQEAQKAYNWVLNKKAQKKYTAWTQFLNNWLRRVSQNEHREPERPGEYQINLEDGTIIKIVGEDGSVKIWSTYAWDLEEIKLGRMKPEQLCENKLKYLTELKESGAQLTKVQALDLEDWKQSAEIRANIHAKWLKGTYAGY